MKNHILKQLTENTKSGRKMLAVLVDPDSISDVQALVRLCKISNEAKVDLILVGGSLITNGFFDQCIAIIKEHTQIPVLLFPGDTMQIDNNADGILFLSLISGRNPDLLIGKHILAAPQLKKSNLEIIPTGYMIVDGGRITSVSYMSNTTPIPADKPAIAATTAMAGEMLGLKLIYMDAGSGAQAPVSPRIIEAVRQNVELPIFVGGGMRSVQQVKQACEAGANVVVVGNAFEENPNLIFELSSAVHGVSAVG